MSLLNVTDEMLKQYANDIMTYNRGYVYYLQGRVKNLKLVEGVLTFYSTVKGGENYNVWVSFNTDGSISGSSCTCPAFESRSKACKHVIATLKVIQEKSQVIKMPKIQDKRVTDIVFSHFQGLYDKTKKEEVALDVMYTLSGQYGSLHQTVGFRVGKNKLYIVKNVEKFIEQIRNSQPIEFGKTFVFDPNIHTFSESDKDIIDVLDDLYESEAYLEKKYTTFTNFASAFRGREVFLTPPVLRKMFKALKGKVFTANLLGTENVQTKILEQDLPLEFTLRKNRDELLLSFVNNGNPLPLTSKGDYFLYGQNIYEVSNEQSKTLPPLLSALDINNKNYIVFSQQQKGLFVSEVLPHIEKIAKIGVDEEVEKSFYREELQAKVYFDKHEDGICATIDFIYGEEKVNPFVSAIPQPRVSAQNESDKRIIIRDIEGERRIVSLFEKADFNVDRGKVYLHDDDKIFEFVTNTLDSLKELAEVFYSDDFKGFKIKHSYSYSGKVRLNEASSMLEFSFDFDEIDKDELENVFSSLRVKKKYHRLKDGSFISLNSPELESLAQLVEHLDISPKDLHDDVIRLPKYRAMYLDNMLRESKLSHIEKNASFKEMVQNVREPEDMDFEIPESLQNVLRDYQKVGFKWLKTLNAYGLGGILADDMGLGKTLEVIAFILSERSKNIGSSLVVAPTSLVYNWKDEVEKFAHIMKVTVISGSPKERVEQMQEIRDSDIVVTSYPLIRRDIDMYGEIEFAYCFLDEAQHIKNPTTINAKTVKQIKAKGYFALTGTPIENSLTELWSIFDFVMPGYLLAHPKFSQRYETPIIRNQDETALKELGRHIRPFVLRRMKKDVLKELPEKIESKMVAEMTPEQRKLYVAYLQKAKGEIAQEIEANGFEKSQIKILAALTRLRQLCCHPSLFIDNFDGASGKMLLLNEIIEDAIDSGHRILLFSQFTSMLNIIRQQLEKQGIEHFYLAGDTPPEVRGQMVKAFNNGKGKIFLISLKAGGTGLNLTGADMVIHYDPWWNPAVEDQATDRAYRIGQKNVVQVMKLITMGTIEEKIFELQKKKKELIDSVIQPGETMFNKMGRDEILQLFEG